MRNTPENRYIINRYAYVEKMVKNIDGCDRIVRREKIFSPLSPPSPLPLPQWGEGNNEG